MDHKMFEKTVEQITDPNLKALFSYLMKKNIALENRVAELERYGSKDTVIIHNLPLLQSDYDITGLVLHFFDYKLCYRMQRKGIRACYTLGNFKNGFPPPVLVKFIYYQDKYEIYKRRRMLADVVNKYNKRPIYMQEWFPKVDAEIPKHEENLGCTTTAINCEVNPPNETAYSEISGDEDSFPARNDLAPQSDALANLLFDILEVECSENNDRNLYSDEMPIAPPSKFNKKKRKINTAETGVKPLTEKTEKVPWKFIRQRPEKVPGCQDMSILQTLEEGELVCKEGGYCFYFSCHKCSPILALDTLNTQYTTKLMYIPRICCIQAPEAFSESFKYSGEVREMYFNYFARIKDLQGIAINGWSNNDAQKLFHDVENTFASHTKFRKSRDFEIDWILMSGSTITVIEVKMKNRASKKETEGNFESKIEQLKKDRMIIQHLLEVTNCTDVPENYVIACPNVSIAEVTEGKLLNAHKQFFRETWLEGEVVGFISEECLGTGNVYVYNGDKLNVEKTSFKSLISRPSIKKAETTSDPDSEKWRTQYRLMTSSVVSSMLVVGQQLDAEGNLVVGPQLDDKSNLLVPDSSSFYPKENKKMRKQFCQDLALKNKSTFPEVLVMGPDQMTVIKDKSRRRLLLGEAGCGKTFVLLYMLFKYTGNHLGKPDLKHVQFVVSKENAELKKYVSNFIDNHCNVKYAHLIEPESLCEDEKIKLILFDEVYNDFYWKKLESFEPIVIAATGITQIMTHNYFRTWNIFHLRNCYRNPQNLSSHCSKLLPYAFKISLAVEDLDRTMKAKKKGSGISIAFRSPLLPWSIATHNGVKVNDENSIQVLEYSGVEFAQTVYEGILAEENNLLLLTDKQEIYKFFTPRKPAHKVLIHGDSTGTENSWSFSGVQYRHVLVIVSNFRNFRGKWKFLYHAFSRAVQSVTIVCEKSTMDEICDLFEISTVDIQVFDKIKASQKVASESILSLESEYEWEEALKLTIINENWDSFKLLTDYLMQSDIDYSRNLFSYLLEIFLWNEDGLILDVIEKSQVSFELSELVEIYQSSARLLTNLPNIEARRKLLPKFKKLLPEGTTLFDHLMENGKFIKDSLSKAIQFFTNCSIWADKETLLQFCSKVLDKYSLSRLSRHITTCFVLLTPVEKVCDNAFDWFESGGSLRNNHEMFDLIYDKCSSLTDEGRLKLDVETMHYKWATVFAAITKLLQEDEET